MVDPDGREVVFDHGTWLHLADRRPWLLDHVEAILATVAFPDHRALDRIGGREVYYARHPLLPARWLRVIVDYDEHPGVVVTAFVDDDPRERER